MPEQTIRHIYPRALTLQAGAVALCGHVKTTPWSGARWTGDTDPDRCTECLNEVRRAG